MQHLKKYVLFQNLEHSFQIKIAIYIWQAIKNGNENLDKIRVDSLFSQETNYEAYSLILISKALIEKGKWSPANLDKIYNAISDYRDEKCISYNYRNKSHVVYGKMLIRYTNKVLNMNLDIIETKVDIKNQLTKELPEKRIVPVYVKTEKTPCPLCSKPANQYDSHIECTHCGFCEFVEKK
ncbi:MAG: hypothetical protein CMM93_04260 [Rickettsiales bacterium]|nr:hypothetical protein [Rickettsiales bacterium]